MENDVDPYTLEKKNKIKDHSDLGGSQTLTTTSIYQHHSLYYLKLNTHSFQGAIEYPPALDIIHIYYPILHPTHLKLAAKVVCILRSIIGKSNHSRMALVCLHDLLTSTLT